MELINFFLRPEYVAEKVEKSTIKHNFKKVFQGLVFGIKGILVAAGIFGIFHWCLGVNMPVKNTGMKQLYHVNYFLAIALLIAPICEEIQDRLYLNLKKTSLFISLIFTGIWFLIPLYKVNEWDEKYLLILVLIIIVSFFLSRILILKPKFFKYYFWFSVTWFAFSHIFNYHLIKPIDYILIPLWVLPQFSYGIALGYIRVNCGILWSIALHIFINTLAFFPEILKYFR